MTNNLFSSLQIKHTEVINRDSKVCLLRDDEKWFYQTYHTVSYLNIRIKYR